MRRHTTRAALLAASLVATGATLDAAVTVRAPLVCSRGPSGQRFEAVVTQPPTAAEGSTYTVRVDGAASGTISHFGLNHIRDMATDYLVGAGATYVPGSARIVPGTGTPNVAEHARVTHEAGLVRLVLPDRVESGSSYTPPSIELRLRVDAPAGASLALALREYRVTANAIVVGDLLTTCKPQPTPYPLATTVVTAAAPP